MQKQAQEKAQIVTEQAKQKVEDFQSKSTQKKTLKTQLIIDKFSTRIQQVITEAKEKIDRVKSQGIKNFNSSKEDLATIRSNAPIELLSIFKYLTFF